MNDYNVVIILTKEVVIFQNKDGARFFLGDRNITVSLDKNDHVLNQIAKKLGVDIQEILDCFSSYTEFFRKREK